MKRIEVTETGPALGRLLDNLKSNPREIVLLRNGHPVATLVPEPSGQNALEVLGDLYRTSTKRLQEH